MARNMKLKRKYDKQYRLNHKKSKREYDKIYWAKNRPKRLKQMKLARLKKLDERKLKQKIWSDNNKPITNANKRRYYHKNKHTKIGQKMRIRAKTKDKYGKVNDKRICRHHHKPYHIDNWCYLETGQHKWMHNNPKSFKIGGMNNRN